MRGLQVLLSKEGGRTMATKGAIDDSERSDALEGENESDDDCAAGDSMDSKLAATTSSIAVADYAKPTSSVKEVPHKKKRAPVKRRASGKKPPAMPKRPLSAYNIFFRDQRAVILEERKPQKGREAVAEESGADLFAALGRIVGERWRRTTSDQRKIYEHLAAEDLVRYRREMDEYSSNIAKRNLEEKRKEHPKNESIGELKGSPPTYDDQHIMKETSTLEATIRSQPGTQNLHATLLAAFPGGVPWDEARVASSTIWQGGQPTNSQNATFSSGRQFLVDPPPSDAGASLPLSLSSILARNSDLAAPADLSVAYANRQQANLHPSLGTQALLTASYFPPGNMATLPQGFFQQLQQGVDLSILGQYSNAASFLAQYQNQSFPMGMTHQASSQQQLAQQVAPPQYHQLSMLQELLRNTNAGPSPGTLFPGSNQDLFAMIQQQLQLQALQQQLQQQPQFPDNKNQRKSPT